MVERLYDPTNKAKVMTFVQDVSRLVEELKSGRTISDQDLEALFAQMKAMVDVVIELASEDPQLPVQFTQMRQWLRGYMRNRRGGDVVNEHATPNFRFQGLIDLVKSENNFRTQQDRLETESWALLMDNKIEAASDRIGHALDLLDRRRAFVTDEQQQLFFDKEGKYLISRFLNEYLRRRQWALALELVERTKARALLSQLGLTRIRKPMTGPSVLMEKEECLLIQARQIASAARSNAPTRDGVRGFELWDQAVTLHLELEDVWTELVRDSAWVEYVSLRRGTAPNLQQMRDNLL